MAAKWLRKDPALALALKYPLPWSEVTCIRMGVCVRIKGRVSVSPHLPPRPPMVRWYLRARARAGSFHRSCFAQAVSSDSERVQRLFFCYF